MTSDEFPDTVSDDDPAFDTSVAHQARMYNYLLGGKDHYAPDRAFARELEAIFPNAVVAARANRDFLGRAVRFLAGEAGLSQFLDIGTGIPAPGSTHEVAQEVRPDARIVYVDHDPVVLSHARAFLVGRDPGTTEYLDADLRQPEVILERAAGILDFSKPVGLLLLAILHAIPDGDDPYGAVATLVDVLPSGSYVAISHGTGDQAGPDAKEKVDDVANRMSHEKYDFRSRAGVARFFEGLDLIEPGLVPPHEWRPGPRELVSNDVLVGVGRKP
ncbi:MAG: SAM-dependent methyltransferase [Nocardiopsaceae bacterium]|nr:SAM-dependent methyltransferase [Nocardiopsaceae bacterium]